MTGVAEEIQSVLRMSSPVTEIRFAILCTYASEYVGAD